jgi:ATP/ADP translocase
MTRIEHWILDTFRRQYIFIYITYLYLMYFILFTYIILKYFKKMKQNCKLRLMCQMLSISDYLTSANDQMNFKIQVLARKQQNFNL